MSDIYSFNLNTEDKDFKEYVSKLKKERELSKAITELLFNKMVEDKSVIILKKELTDLNKQHKINKFNIQKKIETNKNQVKQLYDNCVKELKKNFNGSSKIINVNKFIEFNAKKISLMSGEDRNKITDKIIDEIKK